LSPKREQDENGIGPSRLQVETRRIEMRAAVIQQFGKPLVIEDRPVPEPGPGQIRVKIETSGVCHTDIHAANGDWPIRPTLPLVPGHEGVGLVDALGDGVDRVSLGQRVAIPWLGSADGTCEFCVKGLETYCVAPTFTGYTVDGGFREYSIADARFVGLVPEGIDPLDAAPLTCAGVTTYKAVKAAKVGPSDLVGIVGIGGLGHLGLQYAAIAGAFTVAIDVSEEKLQLAKELGADHTINAAAAASPR
jgi:propanol-preferring alcohol dehydrogenase